jgi:hypothetical protein
MPVAKKKRITAESTLSHPEASSLPLPEQQEFHQHLRALAQCAVRTVLELVMPEELDAFIGAEWGECSPKRKGYRNGTYTRAISQPRRAGSKISKCPEIGKANSTARSLSATAVMNRISRDQPDPDVCVRNQHPQSRRSRSNLAGSRTQSQYDQSAEPESESPI